MDIREFRDCLSEIELDRRRDIASDRAVVRFVLKHLPELEMEDRTPSDILSRETIDLLFQKGMLHLNSMGKARITYIDSGRYVDISDEGEIYHRLFNKWEALGWIRLVRDPAGEISAIHLLDRLNP